MEKANQLKSSPESQASEKSSQYNLLPSATLQHSLKVQAWRGSNQATTYLALGFREHEEKAKTRKSWMASHIRCVISGTAWVLPFKVFSVGLQAEEEGKN